MASPMLALHPMSPAEARTLLATSFEDLVDDIATAHGLAMDEARTLARPMEKQLLPDHEATAGHSFSWMRDGDQTIGRLWLGPPFDERPMLYIWEIVIDRDHRGAGYGSAALDLVIQQSRDAGLEGVQLTVWDTNPDAKRLYERKGFAVDRPSEGRELMVLPFD